MKKPKEFNIDYLFNPNSGELNKPDSKEKIKKFNDFFNKIDLLDNLEKNKFFDGFQHLIKYNSKK
jgi:hypothetical protein